MVAPQIPSPVAVDAHKDTGTAPPLVWKFAVLPALQVVPADQNVVTAALTGSVHITASARSAARRDVIDFIGATLSVGCIVLEEQISQWVMALRVPRVLLR